MAIIKVVPRSITEPYKKREGDFSPNLVGLQFTDQSAAVFTFGNFNVTTNLSAKLSRDFVLGGEWSEYYNLGNLNLTPEEAALLVSNDVLIKLNFNPKNISRYAYFGSFYNQLKYAVENIIKKWKGGIYLSPTLNSNSVYNTVLSFTYDSATNISNFLIPKRVISNPFQLIVDDNEAFFGIPSGGIYNLSFSYDKYVISNSFGDFPLIAYSGSSTSYPYINVTTEGNPFPDFSGGTSFGPRTYHLRPNNTEIDFFFLGLSDLESLLLNRLVTPKYTYSFDVPLQTDLGTNYIETRTVTWPVSDGYNIDINTSLYADYLNTILEIGTDFDKNRTNLVSRRFVSESIHEYDTNGGGDEVYGMKVTKLLKIYGREFDEVKKYIDGISFANVVTYNKLDNTSDELIKLIAKNLGFDVLLTITTDDFDLKQQIATTNTSTFGGYSRSLSPKELDIELWRRLVINAWWLFRSKGTRKVLEFFFNFFKINPCMISLNEYIYLAENKLNMQEVYDFISDFNFYTDESLLPTETILDAYDLWVDELGFPKVLSNTTEKYFQNDGFWYNGGSESTEGNNPHMGPYDVGEKYMNNFRCVFSNFTLDAPIGSITKTLVDNFFTDFNQGSFTVNGDGLPVPYYDTGYENNLNSRTTNATVQEAGLVNVGDPFAPSVGKDTNDTYSMRINFTPGGSGTICQVCSYPLEFASDGIVYTTIPSYGPLTDQNCCYNDLIQSSSGEILCYWCPPQESIIENCNGTNCVLLKPNGQNIINKKCCEIRGGALTQKDDGTYECIKETVPSGGGSGGGCSNYIVQNHVYFTEQTLQLYSETCCNQVNGYWSDGYFKIYDISGNLLSTKQDTVGSLAISSYGVKNYCSTCPQELTLNSNYIFDKQTNLNLSEICCNDYGYNYNSSTSRCTNCPTPTIDTLAPYEIITSNGVDPNCCQVYGGYYYTYSSNNSQSSPKCWSCPDIGGMTIDINNVITYDGKGLTQQCCTAYAAITNQPTSFSNNKCVINYFQQGTEGINQSGIVFITNDGKVYGRRLLNAGNISYLGDYTVFASPENFLLQVPPSYIPSPTPQFSPDYLPISIAIRDTKLWVMNQNGTKILLYNITLNPFTYTMVGELNLDNPAQGLFAVSDTKLLTTMVVGGYRTLVEVDVANISPINSPFFVTATYTSKFTLTKFITENNPGIDYYPSTARVVQIMLNSSSNKLIVLTRNVNGNNQPYIFQYNYGADYYNPVLATNIQFGGMEMYFKVNQTDSSLAAPYGLYVSTENTPNTIYTFDYFNTYVWKLFRTPQLAPTNYIYETKPILPFLPVVTNQNTTIKAVGVTQLPVNFNNMDFTISSNIFDMCSNNLQGPDPNFCVS